MTDPAHAGAPAVDLLDRVRNYLGNGGFFNPEMMENDKVRQLVIDLAIELERLRVSSRSPELSVNDFRRELRDKMEVYAVTKSIHTKQECLDFIADIYREQTGQCLTAVALFAEVKQLREALASRSLETETQLGKVREHLIRLSKGVVRPSKYGIQVVRRDRENGDIEYQVFADTKGNGRQIAWVQSSRNDAEFIAACLAQAALFADLLASRASAPTAPTPTVNE